MLKIIQDMLNANTERTKSEPIGNLQSMVTEGLKLGKYKGVILSLFQFPSITFQVMSYTGKKEDICELVRKSKF